jgi:D-arabinonate dehydratase/D-galactarolactone cycloisomerase
MKIKGVRAIPLTVSRKRKRTQYAPLAGELPILSAVHGCFVEVETDDGMVGTGECTVREVPDAHAAIINTLLKPILVGQNPSDVEVLWTKMFNTLRTRGHNAGVFLESISGADCALWDLLGKIERKPVYRLLGGRFRGRLKAYASSILFGEDAPSLARRLVELGHDQIKLKIGLGYEKDVANIKGIRDSIGYKVEVMVDANSAYSTQEAIRMGRQLERYEIKWFEEPVPPDNLDGYVEVSRSLDVPVAAGESHFGKYAFLDLLKRRAVDIIQPNVGRSGGITEVRKIMAMAEAFNVPYASHTGLSGIGCRAATIQLASTVPDDLFLTYEYGVFPHPFGNYILKRPLEKFSDGYVEVPTEPGVGIELNETAVELYQDRKNGIVWDDTKIIEDSPYREP